MAPFALPTSGSSSILTDGNFTKWRNYHGADLFRDPAFLYRIDEISNVLSMSLVSFLNGRAQEESFAEYEILFYVLQQVLAERIIAEFDDELICFSHISSGIFPLLCQQQRRYQK